MDDLKSQPSWPSPWSAPVQAPLPAPTPPTAARPPSNVATLAPSLPPSAGSHEPEFVPPPVITRAYEHTAHRGPDLVGTGAVRLLAGAGWLGSALVYTTAALVLSKSYRHITSDNWRTALDGIRWMLPFIVSSFGMAYLGWVVWATLAAINGQRVVPLASSPWLPPVAYLFGPALAAAGAIYMPGNDGLWLAAGIAWVCIGHGVVLLSLRGSARRIGADSGEFTRMLWFPLASVGYRAIAMVVLPDTSFNNTALFAVLVAIDVILMMATALAVWRAMHSFDQACARDRYTSVENQLPAFMAAARH